MFTLKKTERLHSRKLIEELFQKGDSLLAYPVKVVYLNNITSEEHPVQAAFSVSKRTFKKAVVRNHLKRRMREAYRLQKPEFYNSVGENKIAMMFIYIAKDKLAYSEIEKGMKKALKKLIALNNHL